jgi:hypothetical protein
MTRDDTAGTPAAPDDGPDSEIASDELCRAAVERARARLVQQGRVVEIRLVRRVVGAEVPRQALDAFLLRLENEGGLTLTPHARPEALDALELGDCVSSPRGPLYFVTWLG